MIPEIKIQTEMYCVMAKEKNPLGAKVSATTDINYLWLYYFAGVRKKYNVYRINRYIESSMDTHRKTFRFIEPLEAELYNEVFDQYMLDHPARKPFIMEEVTLPLAIQRAIKKKRDEDQKYETKSKASSV